MTEEIQIVRCNHCAWEGEEEKLIIADDDIEECPECKQSDGLMDLEVKNTK